MVSLNKPITWRYTVIMRWMAVRMIIPRYTMVYISFMLFSTDNAYLLFVHSDNKSRTKDSITTRQLMLTSDAWSIYLPHGFSDIKTKALSAKGVDILICTPISVIIEGKLIASLWEREKTIEIRPWLCLRENEIFLLEYTVYCIMNGI